MYINTSFPLCLVGPCLGYRCDDTLRGHNTHTYVIQIADSRMRACRVARVLLHPQDLGPLTIGTKGFGTKASLESAIADGLPALTKMGDQV